MPRMIESITWTCIEAGPSEHRDGDRAGDPGADRLEHARIAEGRRVALLLQVEAILVDASGRVDREHQLQVDRCCAAAGARQGRGEHERQHQAERGAAATCTSFAPPPDPPGLGCACPRIASVRPGQAAIPGGARVATFKKLIGGTDLVIAPWRSIRSWRDWLRRPGSRRSISAAARLDG